MFVDRVVINASPLIVLFNSYQDDLLLQLCLIPSVSDRLDRIREAGLYLAPQVIELLKSQANESTTPPTDY